MDASWNNVSSDPNALLNIAQALGYNSVDEMPPVDELTSAQLLVVLESAAEEIAANLQSLMGDVDNPTLDEPAVDFGDGSALTLILMKLQAELGDLQIGSAKEGVKADKEKLAAISERRLEKIQDAIEKMAKADKSGMLGKVFGWIGAIAGLIAAVAATVVTGGALAGVALTLAVVGIVQMALQESGAMDKIMTAMFGDDEKAKMAFQITLMAVMLIASIATGVGAARAASSVADATKMATGIANLIKMSTDAVTAGAKTVGIAAGVIGALVGIGGGAASIHSAVTGYEATEASAESKEFEAWMAKLQSSIEQQQDELREAIENLEQGMLGIGIDILDSIGVSWQKILGGDPA